MRINNVPNGWTKKRLSKIALLQRGRFSIRPRNDPSCYGGDVPFVQTGDVSKAGIYLKHFSQTLNEKGVAVSKVFPANTILITIAANIGDTAITTFPVACPDSLIAINSEHYNFMWLNYVLQTQKNKLNALATQNAQKNINLETLNNLKLLVPPIGEQKKIAEILGTWDRAIEELTGLIAEKKELKRGLMQRLLTGTKRLPGFTKPWRKVKLGEVADLYQPVTISAQELSETGFPVYGANGLIGYYEKYNHDTWQIMITCRGSTCGTVNRTYGKSWITGNAMVVNCDNHNVCKLFLYYNLLNRKFNSVISGSGQPQIVRGPLLKYPLCLPADLAEQKAIADVLSKADSEIDLLNQRLDVLKEQKRGLMQKLLTGEIRVKVDKKS